MISFYVEHLPLKIWARKIRVNFTLANHFKGKKTVINIFGILYKNYSYCMFTVIIFFPDYLSCTTSNVTSIIVIFQELNTNVCGMVNDVRKLNSKPETFTIKIDGEDMLESNPKNGLKKIELY